MIAAVASAAAVLAAGCTAAAPGAPTAGPAPTAAAAPPTLVPATPAPLPTATADPVGFKRTSLQYGVNVFVWGHADTTKRDLTRIVDAGFGWQKSLFQWRAMEPRRGEFDWRESDRVVQASNAAGVKILARLDFQPEWARKDKRQENGAPDDPQDFANFVKALVTRYEPGSSHGELDAIEIWNEPNLQREWGHAISKDTAADYVRLLSAAYKAAKAANPKITVVTAGLSPTGWDDDTARPDDKYLQWMFDAGLKGGVNYDALGLHGNAQAPDPLAAPGSLPKFGDPSFYFRRVEQLRKIQEDAGDASKPVWLLEFGWTSDTIHEQYAWYAVSEQQKAANIVKAYTYAGEHWQPWIGPMFLWVLPEPSWTPQREEYWWAIANPDGTPRPALEAFAKARKDGDLP